MTWITNKFRVGTLYCKPKTLTVTPSLFVEWAFRFTYWNIRFYWLVWGFEVQLWLGQNYAKL